MKNSFRHLVLAYALLSGTGFAISEEGGQSQRDYERTVQSVVRNKYFYKSGRFELTPTAGVMPYDSVMAHYTLGGRATWHLSDHYSWEVGDLQLAFPSVTSYIQSYVKTFGLSNVQTVKIRKLASSNFILSPIYGKVRFFGRQILYFDIYVAAGIGMANTDVVQLSSTGKGVDGVETLLKSGWDPMIDVGFGFKIFLNDAMGLVFDLRDYIVSSETYGKRSFKSNFTVFGGVSFFLPTF